MLFGSWTRSFRSGGYNLRNTINPAVPNADYGKERVDAFEVGFKTEWFNKRLRVNASGFFNDFKNMQFTTLNGTAFSITNSADSTIAGFELETTWFATENLRFDSSVGYINAAYDRLDGLDIDFVRDGVPDRAAKDLDFNQIPEWSAYAGAEYNIPLDWEYGSEVSIRASSTFSDKYALNEQNDAFQQNYFLVDASMSYTFPGENVKLSLFGKNLTDKRYGGAYINNQTTSFPLSVINFTSIQSVNQGRTFGVSLNFEF
jgi:outer membrane receptor protein involved in Fe transport